MATREASARQYDRPYLEGLVDLYLDALLARDPSRLPLAENVRFTENGQALKLGDALWATASGPGTYRHCIVDPEAGQAGFIGVVRENDMPRILVLRLKAADGRISEIETMVIRDRFGAARYEELARPDPVWFELLPAARRAPREALIATANLYFEAMQRNDGKGVYPFADSCNRLEHGLRTTNVATPTPYGHWGVDDFVTLSAKAQFELGLLRFVTAVRDRRFPVVDVERQAVLAFAVFDHDGSVTSVTLTDGRVLKAPPYFLTPRSLLIGEAFKVKNSLLRHIEATLTECPYGMRPGWVG